MKKILLAFLGTVGLILIVPLVIASVILGFALSPIALIAVAVAPVRWEETMVVRYFVACLFILMMIGIVENAF